MCFQGKKLVPLGGFVAEKVCTQYLGVWAATRECVVEMEFNKAMVVLDRLDEIPLTESKE